LLYFVIRRFKRYFIAAVRLLIRNRKKVICLLAKESDPINLAKLIANGTILAPDLLNALQSLSRRCLIEQQGRFYDLPLVVKQYIKEMV
jgi:predicted transcriptional regulator